MRVVFQIKDSWSCGTQAPSIFSGKNMFDVDNYYCISVPKDIKVIKGERKNYLYYSPVNFPLG